MSGARWNETKLYSMEAALAEFRAEDIGVDGEEDVDFIMEKGMCTSSRSTLS